jgi:hypothetical protein
LALVVRVIARTVTARRANACAGANGCGVAEMKAVCGN